MPTLGEKIERLPPDLREEVEDFVDFLLEKKMKRARRQLRLSWAGGLREFRDEYTSLELQKKALEWE